MQKYAKLENNNIVFAPKNKEEILNYNLNIEQMTKDGYKPFVEANKEIGKAYNISYKETATKIIEIADEILPPSETEIEQMERQRLNKLTLTKREVFLALYKAKGIIPQQLKSQLSTIEALIEFEYANNYERGNPLINSIGTSLGYTEADLDYLFENKELPNKTEATETETETSDTDVSNIDRTGRFIGPEDGHTGGSIN